jgi:hypothetical protein
MGEVEAKEVASESAAEKVNIDYQATFPEKAVSASSTVV